MKKRVIGLNDDGELVLKLSDGREVSTVKRNQKSVAFLLLDCSASMEGEKLDQACQGAIGFGQNALSKGYTVGLIAFGSHASLVQPATTSKNTLAEALDGLSIMGSTNMVAAFELAVTHLDHPFSNRVMVLVTDGEPDNRGKTIAVARAAIRTGIEIITIGTDDANQSFLDQISSSTESALRIHAHQLREGIESAARLLPHLPKPR